MSAPRTKRQFAGAASDPAQRQITSFFSRQTSDQDGWLPQLQQQPSSRPALPAMVQSNLLSVGMRVRKSVAEGHKNGVGCDFSMWSSDGAPQKPRAAVHHNHNRRHHHTAPQQAPSSVPPPVPATTAPHHHAHQQQPFDPRSSSYVPLPGTSATRELLPFCGIHNVGGLSAQPDFDPSASAAALPTAVFGGLPSVPDASDVPGLSSSQDSVGSTGSFLSSAAAAASSRKRTYVDNDDDDDCGSDDEVVNGRQDRAAWRRQPAAPAADCEISLLAQAPSPAARVFAEPRARQSRDPWSSAAPLPPKGGRGQQQGAVAVAASDFPEADFLDYGQYSPDLDMGGV
ncbi:hypothetical protein RB597_008912 [Gaeumannomyces tritici]